MKKTKEQMAERLNGRQYGRDTTKEDIQLARESGLVIIYGASDDIVEFEGAIVDEIGAYNGTDFIIATPGTEIPVDEDEETYRKAKCYEVMKAWKEPKNDRWGIDYRPGLTEEFEKLIEAAKEKIKPFSTKEISRITVYFKVKGEDVSSEFDCCDNDKCIKEAKKAIRKQYGKGTHIEECSSVNDGDYESIEVCRFCGNPFNEWLTWCDSELEYLEENKPWDAKFLSDEGFVIGVILNSTPTMDCDISGYAKHQGGEILKKALESREIFFKRIGQLAKSVIDADFESCSKPENFK